jgi:hypothetical protein
MPDEASLYEFVRIGEVAETTTQLLALSLQHTTALGGRSSGHPKRTDPVEQYVLQQARDFVGQVREGFVLSVKRTQVPTRAELRFLIERVLLDWSTLSQELGLEADAPPAELPEHERRIENIRHQLLAFGMAVTALGFLPRTPAADITFPYSFGKPPTYGDIPTPATPAELLQRIEEIETMIGRILALDLQALLNHQYGPLRRTYGFFEASALLARQEMERFGVKQPRPGLHRL